MYRKPFCAAVLGVVALFAANAVVRAEEVKGVEPAEPRALFLVATPQLVDPIYAQTVLLVVPVSGGRHAGIVINRPSNHTLASLFPEHAPSKQVSDPVHVGGPYHQSALFAVVRSGVNPGAGSIQLMGNLFLSGRSDTVDKIIETTPNEARFYAGLVMWEPDELSTEVRSGAWYVMDPDPEAVFRVDMKSLWEELVRLIRSPRADLLGVQPAV
jgi:putative transcriptional regulator